MVRTVIRPEKTDVHISIPKDNVGKEIEITCLALEELNGKPPSKRSLSELVGTLSHETAEAMLKYMEEGRKEWIERTK